MSTIVLLHAHPDDEASQTAGTMRLAADAGHRVVCVYATDGDHGTVPADLAEGETVGARRRVEAAASAEVLGTARVAWLGYADSGMTGWEQNEGERAFARASTEEAAARLVAVLDEEDADAVVGYDWHGGYGHPDHVKVHHVVHRAAGLAARRPRVLEATMNRDELRRGYLAAKEAGEVSEELDWDPDAPADDGNPFGTPEAELHWRVDVRGVLDAKRRALACHASQEDVRWMLAMGEQEYARAFGVEWYVEPGRPSGLTSAHPLD